MHPHALHVLARIICDERLAEAEAIRRLRLAKRAQRREAAAVSDASLPVRVPARSTG